MCSGHVILIFKLFFTFLLLQNAFAKKGDPNSTFSNIYGYETLEGEQISVNRMPLGSDTYKFLELFFKTWTINGDLPEEYTSEAANTIKVFSVLIPEEEVKAYFSSNLVQLGQSASILKVTLNGKKYFRAFFHPYAVKKQKINLKGFLPDPVDWVGTPSSSMRSFYMKATNAQFPRFTAKLSLPVVSGSGYKVIKESALYRAVTVTNMIENIHTLSNGIIPNTNKTWEYFPEQEGLYPFEGEIGGTAIRIQPTDYGSTIYIPWLALIADQGKGHPRWIDKLFLASGYSDKTSFVWNELIKPLVELDGEFSIKNGISTMFHQQNVVVAINRSTKRINGLGVRDKDSHWVDYATRKYFLNLDVPEAENFLSLAKTFGYILTTQFPMAGYEFYTTPCAIHGILKYFLNAKELQAIKILSNQVMLNKFNETYGSIYKAKKYSEIQEKYKLIYEAILPLELKPIYAQVLRESQKSKSLKTKILDRLIPIHLKSLGARSKVLNKKCVELLSSVSAS